MDLMQLAEAVGERLNKEGLMLVTAESCTGGGVAQAVTAVSGSSHWFERGFVTYTNSAKQEMLGVAAQTLEQYGAVSEQTVCEMAQGALQHSHAHVALAISGVAGPGGGSLEKPVGTVCLAWAGEGREPVSRTEHFLGDREAVRRQAVERALQGVLDLLGDG
jgi:nicotinamide-nucleotide amidase